MQEVASKLILLTKNILTVKWMNQAVLATIKYLIQPVPLVLIPECAGHDDLKVSHFSTFIRFIISCDWPFIFVSFYEFG